MVNGIKLWRRGGQIVVDLGLDAGNGRPRLPEEPFVVIVIAYPKPRNRISIEHAQRSHT
jgi:hypothetical protein